MKGNIFYLSLIGLLLTILTGCKHAEKVVIEKKLKQISVRRAVRMVSENEIKFNTLSVRKVEISINNDGEENSARGIFKIKKDSIIQASAQWLAIPLGKLEIGTDSFRMVAHRGKFAIAESLQKLGENIGYDIDFQILQSILSNHIQPIKFDQKENQFKEYVLNIEENMYKISSLRDRRFRKISNNEDKLERFKQRKDESHLVKQDIFIDPDIFVVRKFVFSDIDSGKIITITFSEFKPLGDKWFPENIKLSVSGAKKLELNLGLSKVSIDDEKDFNFTIPPKYKRETLKKE